MTTYITQEQASLLANEIEFVQDQAGLTRLCNAAIQHYRDSLVAGVVLPEPHWYHRIGAYGVNHFYGPTETQPNGCTGLYTADQLRQAIADALAKREPDYEQSETYLRKTDGIEALAKQVPQWLPIETAPKDGTVIGGWRPTQPGNIVRIKWAHHLAMPGQPLCWVTATKSIAISHLPTYWMPLPAAPDPEEAVK